jgi:hypothetical protein
MYTQLTRCFKIMGCLCSFSAATNGILQGCPLSVILINLMTSIWKKILDAQSQAMCVSSARLPPGGKPREALDFILTALGYADDTYGMAAGQHRASGPLILKRIDKASALLDTIHGVQGDSDDRCKVVAVMVNATGLHASEIVAISQKDIRPFETRILKAIWGASRPGRAKEIVFCFMCQGHRFAPSLLVPYGRAVWLARLCKTLGTAMITAQAVWEEGKRIPSRTNRDRLVAR